MKGLDKNRQLINILFELSKALRCCQRDEVFCRNVTFTQFHILDTVSASHSVSMTELNAILSVEKSTATRLVDPLVKQGLVARKKSPEDSRVTMIRLTKMGEEVLADLWQCVEGFVGEVEKRIPESSREETYSSIILLMRAIKDACEPGNCRC